MLADNEKGCTFAPAKTPKMLYYAGLVVQFG